MQGLPLPTRTDRLVIRSFEARDRELEIAISASPSLFEHLAVGPRSEAELDEYVRARLEDASFDRVGSTVALVVEDGATGEYVGSLQLSPIAVEPLQLEIGWIALPGHQGKGLMTEAVTEVVELVFDHLDAHRIVAQTNEGNQASVRLAERIGFRKEAHFVRSLLVDGEWRDEIVYAMLRDDRSAT